MSCSGALCQVFLPIVPVRPGVGVAITSSIDGELGSQPGFRPEPLRSSEPFLSSLLGPRPSVEQHGVEWGAGLLGQPWCLATLPAQPDIHQGDPGPFLACREWVP